MLKFENFCTFEILRSKDELRIGLLKSYNVGINSIHRSGNMETNIYQLFEDHVWLEFKNGKYNIYLNNIYTYRYDKGPDQPSQGNGDKSELFQSH